jgi:Na+-transporting methylmalonyl-CoA/oxaloacetate decarboxylase gamma subunit
MGLTPLMLWLACLLVTRNQRILTAWDTRQADNARRAAAQDPPQTSQDPRQPRRHHSAAITAAAVPHHRRHANDHPGLWHGRQNLLPGPARTDQKTSPNPATAGTRQPPTRMSDPNVKMVPTET